MKKSIWMMFILGFMTLANAQTSQYAHRNLNWVKDFEVLVKLDTQKENSIYGIDLNENGIRDDVEEYVNKKFGKDPFQKALFMEAAQKMQTIITLPQESSVAEHQVLDEALLQLYTCRDYILYRDEDVNIEQEMLNKTLFKAKVLNTQERLEAYIAHKKKLPFTYNELTEQRLQQEKESCLARYRAYKNPDQIQHTKVVKNN